MAKSKLIKPDWRAARNAPALTTGEYRMPEHLDPRWIPIRIFDNEVTLLKELALIRDQIRQAEGALSPGIAVDLEWARGHFAASLVLNTPMPDVYDPTVIVSGSQDRINVLTRFGAVVHVNQDQWPNVLIVTGWRWPTDNPDSERPINELYDIMRERKIEVLRYGLSLPFVVMGARSAASEFSKK
jgi:hypothetical protein